jgi:hypothetical protein
MIKIFRILFSSPVAMVAGIGSIGALVFLISEEKSVQPLRNHLWAEEMISVPLAAGTLFQQKLIVPAGLEQEIFLLGLFFGCPGGACAGGAEVTLSQGSHEQTHTVAGLSPDPTLRHRFKFNGFSEGVAVLQIKGVPGNTESAPGLLYIGEGEGAQLEGPGLEAPAFASVDWFKVVPGNRKLSSVFPNKRVRFFWLLPFAGLFGLAWAGMRPTSALNSKDPGE